MAPRTPATRRKMRHGDTKHSVKTRRPSPSWSQHTRLTARDPARARTRRRRRHRRARNRRLHRRARRSRPARQVRRARSRLCRVATRVSPRSIVDLQRRVERERKRTTPRRSETTTRSAPPAAAPTGTAPPARRTPAARCATALLCVPPTRPVSSPIRPPSPPQRVTHSSRPRRPPPWAWAGTARWAAACRRQCTPCRRP